MNASDPSWIFEWISRLWIAGGALFVAAGLAVVALRRSTPALRHWLLTLAFGGATPRPARRLVAGRP